MRQLELPVKRITTLDACEEGEDDAVLGIVRLSRDISTQVKASGLHTSNAVVLSWAFVESLGALYKTDPAFFAAWVALAECRLEAGAPLRLEA